MVASVKVRDDTLKLIERIQAELLLNFNGKYTKMDILDACVRLAYHDMDRLVKIIKGRSESRSVVDFITSPVQGGGPEDYREYNYEDL